jgi:hypothetical protein
MHGDYSFHITGFAGEKLLFVLDTSSEIIIGPHFVPPVILFHTVKFLSA